MYELSSAVTRLFLLSGVALVAPQASAGQGSTTAQRPVVVGAAAAHPGWLQSACAPKQCRNGSPSAGRVVSSNGTFGVLRTHAGLLMAAKRGEAIVGPLHEPVPMKGLIVLDDGRLVGVSAEGVMWSAASLKTAMGHEGWAPVPKVPILKTLRGAGPWLAYLDTAGHAFVGRWPAGRASPELFKPVTPKKVSRVISLAIRSDGTVALRGAMQASKGAKGGTTRIQASATHTFIRRARQPRFVRSDYDPQTLHSFDGWIWSGRQDCVVVLAEDGKSWLHLTSGPGTAALATPANVRARWRSILSGSPVPRGYVKGTAAAYFRAGAPTVKEHVKAVVRKSPKCSVGRGAILGVISARSWCRGVHCLAGTVGPTPKPRPLALALFGDATCAATAPVKPNGVAAQNPRCIAALTRKPTVAIGNRSSGSLETATLPVGCQPVSLRSLAGLAILVCEDKKTRRRTVFTASHKALGKWSFEGAVGGLDTSTGTLGADGTLMFQRHCPRRSTGSSVFGELGGGVSSKSIEDAFRGPGGLGAKSKAPKKVTPPPGKPPCQAWVRHPLPVGTPDAWRLVKVPGAGVYRVGLGGHVVALLVDSKAEYQLRLVHVGADGMAKPEVSVTVGEEVVSVEVDAVGSVVVVDKVSGGTANERRRRVLMDGTMRPPVASRGGAATAAPFSHQQTGLR